MEPGQGAPEGSWGDVSKVLDLKMGLAYPAPQLEAGLGCLHLPGTLYFCISHAHRPWSTVSSGTGTRSQAMICGSFNPFGNPCPEGVGLTLAFLVEDPFAVGTEDAGSSVLCEERSVVLETETALPFAP